jgi:hypothetical protein
LSDDIPEMAEQTDVHNLVTGKLPIILAHSGQIQTLTISQQTANQTRSDQAGDLPGATGVKKTVIPGRVCQRNPRRHPAIQVVAPGKADISATFLPNWSK